MEGLSAPYIKWLAGAGIHMHPDIDIKHSPELGFHVIARKKLVKTSVLVSVPFEACRLLSPLHPKVRDLRERGAPPLCLSATLLAESIYGARSCEQLGEHANVLRDINPTGTLLSWTDSHKQLLENTGLDGSWRSNPVKDRLESIVLPFLKSPESTLSIEDPTLDKLMHAATLVLTRCFHAPVAADKLKVPDGVEASLAQQVMEGPFLVPVCDFFNFHPAKYSTQLALHGDEFRYELQRDIEAGEEIYAFYGALSDGQILHTYGYVPDMCEKTPEFSAAHPTWGQPNPFNAVTVKAATVFDTAVDYADGDVARAKLLKKLLKKTSLLSDCGFTLQLAQQNTAVEALTSTRLWLENLVPTDLLDCAYVCVQSPDTLEEIRAEVEKDASDSIPEVRTPAGVIVAIKQSLTVDSEDVGDTDDLIEELEMTVSVWEFVLNVLAAAIKAYPSALKDDEQWHTDYCAKLSKETVAAHAGVKRRREKSGEKASVWDLSVTEAVDAAWKDSTYAACRIVAMREKQLLTFVCRCIADQLEKARIFGEQMNG